MKLIVALAAELGELPVTPSFFRVYNRHLTQGSPTLTIARIRACTS